MARMQPESHTSTLALAERVRMMRDGLINYSSLLITGVSSIILIPIFVRHLGAEFYGIWLAAFAISGIVAAFDFGLAWSVTREIAANLHGTHADEMSIFVQAAGQAYIALGLVGGALIAVGGAKLSPGLHLSAQGSAVAPLMFAILGIAFLADRVFSFSTAVLAGLRRFDLLNILLIVSTVARTAVTIVVLLAGSSVNTVAAVYAVVAWGTALASQVVVVRMRPEFQMRRYVLHYRVLRPHFSFGINTLLTTFAAKAIWESAPLILGFVRGSAAIVPFQIGQRLPTAISDLNWRVSEVLFPAAGAQQNARDMQGMRALLEFGTRWSVVLTLPLCLLLAIVAPDLLTIWIGNPPQESIWVLRIMSAAIACEAIGVGANNVLLGRGAAGTVCIVHAVFSVPILLASFALVKTIGIIGPAIALLAVLLLISLVLLHIAARRCGTSIFAVLLHSIRGVVLPTIASVACTLLLLKTIHPRNWTTLIAMVITAVLVYSASLYFKGGREEERELVRASMRVPVSAARWAYIWIRGHRPIVE